MPNQPERSKNRLDDLLDEINYGVAPPNVDPAVPEYIKKHIEKAKEKVAEEKNNLKRQYPDVNRPMTGGFHRFLFGPNITRAWIYLSISSFFVLASLIIPLAYADNSAHFNPLRAFFIFLPLMFALGHIATYMLTIVESVANGLVEITALPEFNPFQWFVNFWRVFVLSIPILVIGVIFRRFIFTHEQYQFYIAFVDPFCFMVLFPILLLGSFFADGSWLPLGIVTVLRSMTQIWWAWALFYVETFLLAFVLPVFLLIISFAILPIGPLLFPIYALAVLIYSFLLGRLAWCIDKARDK